MTVVLKPHQEKAVEALSNGRVLKARPGSGKTFTALAYYDKYESPRNVVVITTAKKRDSFDWETSAARFGLTGNPEATMGGTIVVDSWNNIQNYTDHSGYFFIFDEQRIVGSGAWSKSFIKIAKHNQWIVLTGTPGDTWIDYIPLFVANGWYKNRSAFLNEHVVFVPRVKFPKIQRYTNVGKLVRLRDELLVEMEFKSHTTENQVVVPVDFDEDLVEKVVKKRWHVYKDRPLRDVGELFLVMRKVVNSDASRLEALKTKILPRHSKVIVFYNFDYELEILRTLKERPDTSVSEWNGHKHEPIPTTDRWVYLVQYVAGAEAWDCIETDCVVFYSLTYSYKNFAQAKGRIDRLNTPFSVMNYYLLVSKAAIDKMISGSLSDKKSFNERDFARKQGFLGKIA